MLLFSVRFDLKRGTITYHCNISLSFLILADRIVLHGSSVCLYNSGIDGNIICAIQKLSFYIPSIPFCL